MQQICNTDFKLRIFKQRDFDTEFRFHTIQTELYDNIITMIPPNYADHDTLFVPIRLLPENIESDDISVISKEDTTSFFSAYTPGSDRLVNAKFISRDLRVISNTSIRLRQPLSNFDRVKALTANVLQYSSDDSYVIIDFSGAFSCTDLKLFSEGMLAVLCNNSLRATANDHATLINSYDLTSIYQIGVVDGTSLPSTSISYFSSIYIGFLFIPITSNYYFAIDGDDSCEFEIDGNIVSPYYGSHGFSGTQQGAATVYLTQGFHKIIVRHTNLAGNGGVTAYFRVRTSDGWLPFTVSNCRAKGLELYCIPYTYGELQAEGSSFVVMPAKMQLTNLFYLSIYTPLIFLARPGSNILTNDFRQFKMLPTPTSISIPKLREGNTAYLMDDFTFPYGAVGIATNVDFADIEKCGITYTYATPVEIDYVEIKEASQLQTSTYNNTQALTLGFECRNRSKNLISSWDLKDMIDLDRSQNITSVDVRNSISVRITKTLQRSDTIIYFKDTALLTEFNIFPTAITGAVWGFITSVRGYGIPSNITTFDATGKAVNFFESTVEDMRTFKFSEIAYIPSFFHPQNTPTEVVYNSEYMLYTLQFSGAIPPVVFYGMSYQVQNTDNFETIYNILTRVDLSEFTGKKTFNAYGAAHREITYPFAFLGFDRDLNKIILTDYETISYEIINTTGSTQENVYVEVPAPNLGYGYSGVDGVYGLNQDASITSDPMNWDSNSVLLAFTSLSAGASTITLTRGDFGQDITGFDPAISVKVVPHLIYLPSILVYIPLIVPMYIQEICVMLDDVSNPLSSSEVLFADDEMTVGFVDITEVSGNNATDVQVQADVKEVLFHYGRYVPFIIFDQNYQSVETIYVNKNGSFVSSIADWDGTVIQFHADLEGGEITRFYLRIQIENGTTSHFSSSLYASYVSNVISVDAGIRAVGEINSLIDYKSLEGTPILIYKHTGIDETVIEVVT